MTKHIFWLASYPKSGNTLLRAILSSLFFTENGIFKGFNISAILSIIFSFNFFRLSELQELLFAYYFMWHSLFLRGLYFNRKYLR